MFFAPAIIFFAVSGALQTFRLQEVKGYGATPPEWIVWIATVHMDQTEPKADDYAGKPPKPGVAKPKPTQGLAASGSPLALKIFVGLLSIGLIVSAVIGILIALNNVATRRISAGMLSAGVLFPLVLLFA